MTTDVDSIVGASMFTWFVIALPPIIYSVTPDRKSRDVDWTLQYNINPLFASNMDTIHSNQGENSKSCRQDGNVFANRPRVRGFPVWVFSTVLRDMTTDTFNLGLYQS